MESQVSALERLHKKLAETILDGTKQECQRVKQLLEQNMQSLGNAVMDCLRRRGKQLKAKVLPSPYAMSTPTVTSASPFDTGQRSIHFSAPIKIEFPKFSSQEGEDPIAYLEKCDEYLAIHPLSSTEILSMLPSVLIHTAKDWWIAERTRVKTWAQFKTLFLRSFLPDDHEVEAERKIRERKQEIGESIHTFVYQYRALCLRLKPSMTEREILQPTFETAILV